MTSLRTSIINKYKLQVRNYIYKKDEFINSINSIGKLAYDLNKKDIYEINYLNISKVDDSKNMNKFINEAKKNMEIILKSEKNDDIINSHESIIKEFEDNL